VVLAHSQCGAVTEAVDVYLEPRRYIAMATDPSIRSIEDQILIAVRVAAMGLEMQYGSACGRKPGYRSALIEVSAALNAAWSAFCLQQEFRAKFLNLNVVFGTYDLISRYVRLPISPCGELTEEEKGLFEPPHDVDGFRELALQTCGGKLVRTLIGSGNESAPTSDCSRGHQRSFSSAHSPRPDGWWGRECPVVANHVGSAGAVWGIRIADAHRS
jgi:carbonic anhydrase